jgi:hypothetical protein
MKTNTRIAKYLGEAKSEDDAFNELSAAMKGVNIKDLVKAANTVFPKKLMEVNVWDAILAGLAKKLVKQKK